MFEYLSISAVIVVAVVLAFDVPLLTFNYTHTYTAPLKTHVPPSTHRYHHSPINKTFNNK